MAVYPLKEQTSSYFQDYFKMHDVEEIFYQVAGFSMNKESDA